MAESTATAPKPSSSVKLVLLGEAAVGKVRPARKCNVATQRRAMGQRLIPTPTQSSLVLRFVNNDFQENKEPTIGGPFK